MSIHFKKSIVFFQFCTYLQHKNDKIVELIYFCNLFLFRMRTKSKRNLLQIYKTQSDWKKQKNAEKQYFKNGIFFSFAVSSLHILYNNHHHHQPRLSCHRLSLREEKKIKKNLIFQKEKNTVITHLMQVLSS